MIIKPILEKVKDHLQNEYNVNIFSQSGLRLAYVVYQAYITNDSPIMVSSELLRKSHELLNDGSSYTAFERAVYRELKAISDRQGKDFYILRVVYDIAKGVKIWANQMNH